MSCNVILKRSKSLSKNALSLEEFIFRQKVLSTYRSLMRVIYKHHEKSDLVLYAKQEFKQNVSTMELSQRRYLLQDGIRQINAMATPFGWNLKL